MENGVASQWSSITPTIEVSVHLPLYNRLYVSGHDVEVLVLGLRRDGVVEVLIWKKLELLPPVSLSNCSSALIAISMS